MHSGVYLSQHSRVLEPSAVGSNRSVRAVQGVPAHTGQTERERDKSAIPLVSSERDFSPSDRLLLYVQYIRIFPVFLSRPQHSLPPLLHSSRLLAQDRTRWPPPYMMSGSTGGLCPKRCQKRINTKQPSWQITAREGRATFFKTIIQQHSCQAINRPPIKPSAVFFGNNLDLYWEVLEGNRVLWTKEVRPDVSVRPGRCCACMWEVMLWMALVLGVKVLSW